MKVYFTQVYLEPGASFDFSYKFQEWLSGRVSAVLSPSEKYSNKYGDDFDLTFNISAKHGLTLPEVCGPTLFRKTKDVEYFVYLPGPKGAKLDWSQRIQALEALLESMALVLEELDLDTSILRSQFPDMVRELSENSAMLNPIRPWQ